MRPSHSPHRRSLTVSPLVFAAALLAAFVFMSHAAADDASVVAERLFVQQVKPILASKCFACHGEKPDDVKGKLNVLSREGLLRGGESGEASLVPGKPDESLLMNAVRWDGLEMPPKANDRLTAQQIEVLRQWIAAGAPWPDEARQKLLARRWSGDAGDGGVTVKTSGGLSDEWTNRRYAPADLWAYQPIQRGDVPWDALREDDARHPIDAFIQQKLAERNLRPAPRADAATLIRRLSFGLTGLPPTAEQFDEWVSRLTLPRSRSRQTLDRDMEQDPKVWRLRLQETPIAVGLPLNEEAYAELVDQLLSSPRYGERMAQHWLDVVRYADTSGYSNDWERPHAWRYRDYVIRSFNTDKPFDRFVLEQIAGDELTKMKDEGEGMNEGADAAQLSTLNSKPSSLLVATGFLRMGPWEQTGMSVAAETRQLWLDDVTNSIGETFLGHALRCAKCHDHKFDPIPTRDYYRIQAAFASTQFDDAKADFLPSENVADAERQNTLAAQQLSEAGLEPITDLEGDNAFTRIKSKLADYRNRALARYEPVAFSVKSAKPDDVSILIGGSLEQPGPRVEPGVLSLVTYLSTSTHGEIPTAGEGRRLALARWIADADNPLTARVIVNRVWQWHFGRGLVATPNNFGKTGAKPSHPELLDWLAAWFIDHGWSIKELNRLIVTSETYRRSTSRPDCQSVPDGSAIRPTKNDIAELDPDNTLLSHFSPRRLTAEEIRDATLAVTGELSLAAGGPGMFPEINWEVALQPRHIMGGIATSYRPSLTREQRNRRTIYAYRYRGLSNPLLEVFNQPSPDLSCERRDETTVTPQAFELFNGQFVHDRALALANRIVKQTEVRERQIELAFRLVYSREPSHSERRAALAHVQRMLEDHRQHAPQPQTLPAVVERQMIAEETGVLFRWREKLFLENYEPDLKPWEVPAETRALAELCLVLLNSSEFLYVY